MRISMGVSENLARQWNEEEDIIKKKRLTIECWFLRLYCERLLLNE